MASYSYKAQIDALKTERQWLMDDNNLQRAKVDELTEEMHILQNKFFSLREESQKDKRTLEFLITLGREMYNEGQFYKNSYYSLFQHYHQLLFHLNNRKAASRTKDDTKDYAITAVCPYRRALSVYPENLAVIAARSCRRAPVVSPEGSPQAASSPPHTVAQNSIRLDHNVALFSLRVFATPAHVLRPRLLSLAFPFAEIKAVGKNYQSTIERKTKIASTHEVDVGAGSSGSSLKDSAVTSEEFAFPDDDQLPEAEFPAKKEKGTDKIKSVKREEEERGEA
ncbi:hypothetical protein ACROYT_G044661 [Oculina patagonica]